MIMFAKRFAPLLALLPAPAFAQTGPSTPVPTANYPNPCIFISATICQGIGLGNPLPISGALSQPDTLGSGNIPASTANAAYSMAIGNGQSTAGVMISGLTASGATLVPEGTYDGVNWVTTPVVQVGSKLAISAITADGQYRLAANARRGLRLRVSAVGTGTINVTSTVSIAPFDVPSPTLDSNGYLTINNTGFNALIGGAPNSSGNPFYNQITGGTLTANIGTTNGLALDTTLSALSAKLPSSLGPKTGATSFSVVPNTDIPFPTTGNAGYTETTTPLTAGNSTSGIARTAPSWAVRFGCSVSSNVAGNVFIYRSDQAARYVSTGALSANSTTDLDIPVRGASTVTYQCVYTNGGTNQADFDMATSFRAGS